MNDPDPTDDQLVLTARAGGPKGQRAFATLVARYKGWLLGFLVRLLGNRSDAEDVAQETFVRAFLALSRFQLDHSAKTWLRVIATRLAYNRIRDKATRSRYRSAFGDLPRLAPGTADRLALQELLSRALTALPYPYREILILHHVEELSVKEVSATLGIGLSAAKMRLSRARAEFVEIYNREADRHERG